MTIVEKLKLNHYHKKIILNQPDQADYFKTLDPTNLTFDIGQETADLVIIFTYSKEEFITQIKGFTSTYTLEPNGYLFVAYPKIGNSHYPDTVHRDEIFPALGIDPDGDGYMPNTLYKFSRMVSLDESFTIVGLKYAPKKQRPTTNSSQKVADYINLIPTIIEKLADAPEVLSLFNQLTPGYQRNWARFIYSAKQLATQEKRYQEMLLILRAGYKSKDLYQRRS